MNFGDIDSCTGDDGRPHRHEAAGRWSTPAAVAARLRIRPTSPSCRATSATPTRAGRSPSVEPAVMKLAPPPTAPKVQSRGGPATGEGISDSQKGDSEIALADGGDPCLRRRGPGAAPGRFRPFAAGVPSSLWPFAGRRFGAEVFMKSGVPRSARSVTGAATVLGSVGNGFFLPPWGAARDRRDGRGA